MTAIGLGAAAQTYAQNVDALFLRLSSISPPPLNETQLLELRMLLATSNFTFVLHTAKKTNVDLLDIRASLNERHPNAELTEITGW